MKENSTLENKPPVNSSTDITVRRSEERGHIRHGWLDTKHTFSFGNYMDPEHMGFRTLRVINQDRVVAGAGFPTHPHRNMEIFSYVVNGAIAHKDSMGNGRELLPGQIQLMSAGSGVTHSEFNPSDAEELHLLQIWIEPREKNLPPSYTEWHTDEMAEANPKALVISSDGRNNSARIGQDADIYRVKLNPGQGIDHDLRDGHGLWLQVISGPVQLNDTELAEGDGASSESPGAFRITALDEPVEAILFDLN